MKNQYSIFDKLIEGMQVIDRDFRYLYLNHAIVQQSKATRERLIGSTMMECYPGIENSELFHSIVDCIHYRTSRRMLNEFKFPDGSVGFFQLSIQPVDDGVLIMSVDVTEQKTMERELRRSNEQLKLSQELALIGSYEYEVTTGSLKWSPTTFVIMGRNESEGEPNIEEARRQIHPEDAEKVSEAIKKAISTGAPYTNEYRIIPDNGKTKHIRAIAKPTRDEHGQVTLIRGCVQDITAQKEIESAHRQKDKSYRLLFEGIQESFVVYDVVTNHTGEIVDLRYNELNPVTEKLLGRARADLVGYTQSQILGAVDKETLEIVKRVVLKGEPVKLERYLPLVDRWFNVLIYSPQNGQIATLNMDITDRKKAQEKLEQLNDELEEKVTKRTQELISALEREREVNEMKSKFVTIASHEFRTPLTTLLSSSFLVEEFIKAGEIDKTGKHIQRIKDSVRFLTSILEELLSLENIDQGKLTIAAEHFDLVSFVQNVVDKLNAITKTNQQIVYSHRGPTELTLDKKILEHVLLNLLSNGIKYSSHNVNLLTIQEDRKLKIIVEDKGIGIPENERRHIFNTFFRASNAANIQGTGLGLHIVRKYMELLRGTIDFTSSQTGTTFSIQIPLTDY